MAMMIERGQSQSTYSTVKLTQDRLKQLLLYDPITGIFRWKVSVGRAKKCSIAGGYNADGYIRIAIGGKLYFAHSLAWLYIYGEYPYEIDHKDRIRDNNIISNLRKATRSQNNHRRETINSTGYKGVHMIGRKYQAKINVEGQQIYLGTFLYPEEAAIAYVEASKKYFGEFANG